MLKFVQNFVIFIQLSFGETVHHMVLLEFRKLYYSIFLAVIYRTVHILAPKIWILGWADVCRPSQPKIQMLGANICTVLYMTAKNIE